MDVNPDKTRTTIASKPRPSGYRRAKRHPNGFPRYFDKGSNLSAMLMKHFKAHKLLPTPKHAIYSFRHSFKDRLKAAETPEELIDELMGHTIGKPKYGDGRGESQYFQLIC